MDTENKEVVDFENAIKSKDYKIVEDLINKNPSIVNAKSSQKIPFINIAINTDFKIARLLINKGADVNQLDQLGFTPIYNMIKNIETFLQYDITSEDIIEMFQLVITNGAMLNVQDRRGNTPINYIAQRAKSSKSIKDMHTKAGKLILALDKNVSETIQIKNNMGKSPLDYLSRNGNFILRDAVFSRLPHVQEAINRTIAETEATTKKILNATSDDKVLS